MENTEDKKHDDEETSYARIEPYTNPAGGWGALLSVARNLKRQEVFKKGAITLLNINQPTGFEPYRVCRRPIFLRECPDEKTKIYH